MTSSSPEGVAYGCGAGQARALRLSCSTACSTRPPAGKDWSRARIVLVLLLTCPASAAREHLIASYADDVVEGIERLGLDAVTLVGHSLGGAVATSVAERCPEVSSLALLAPAGFGPIPLADLFAIPGIHRVAMTALPLALMTPPLVLGGYMAFVSHGRRPTRELVLRIGGDAWPTASGVRAAVRTLQQCAHAPDAFHLRRVAFDGPVAALWGSHDVLVPPDHARGLRAALPQARVEVWSGMGHHPQHERTAELALFIERCARHNERQPNTAKQLVHHASRNAKRRSAPNRRSRRCEGREG